MTALFHILWATILIAINVDAFVIPNSFIGRHLGQRSGRSGHVLPSAYHGWPRRSVLLATGPIRGNALTGMQEAILVPGTGQNELDQPLAREGMEGLRPVQWVGAVPYKHQSLTATLLSRHLFSFPDALATEHGNTINPEPGLLAVVHSNWWNTQTYNACIALMTDGSQEPIHVLNVTTEGLQVMNPYTWHLLAVATAVQTVRERGGGDGIGRVFSDALGPIEVLRDEGVLHVIRDEDFFTSDSEGEGEGEGEGDQEEEGDDSEGSEDDGSDQDTEDEEDDQEEDQEQEQDGSGEQQPPSPSSPVR